MKNIKTMKNMKSMKNKKSVILGVMILSILSSFTAAVTATAAGAKETFSLRELGDVALPQEARELLGRNGFVVIPGGADEICDIYTSAKDRGQPAFVTTDAVLHTAHIFFDFLLRILETEKLYDAADELTDRMLALSERQYEEAGDGRVKEAARLNMGYFSVAQRLFHPQCAVRPEVAGLVDRELANIDEHAGLKERPLLAYVERPSLFDTPYAYEDYSQYVPRGHYTRNERFQRYFRAMMWYGRMDFKLRPGTAEPALTHGRKMTLQALLMTAAFLCDKEAFRLWQRIYEPTVFFVGQTDDAHPEDYVRLARKIYPAAGSVDKYGDEAKLSDFIAAALQLRPPKILSGAAFVEDGEFAAATKGFRFMGQRFIPDSYMFQEMVFGKKGDQVILAYTGTGKPFTMEVVPNWGPVRAFPRGLDIMAILGSARALEILRAEGDTEYTYYGEQLSRLRGEFDALSSEGWEQNLYWRWLYSLLPLLKSQPGQGTPPFMRSTAWLDKALQTALGSWTELRHDTILYAKQSYTMMARAMPPRPKLTYGYVEPYPEVYGRLEEMMRDLRAHLASLGIARDEVSEMIADFEEVLAALGSISEKELAGETPTDEEYGLIRNIGGRLSALKQFPAEIMEKITSGTDEKMDLVADVHTELNTGQVLEEGVGAPSNIYVIVDDASGYRLCRGGVFSYYEFKQPLDERLTDEAWQEMGEQEQRPAQPDWVAAFTVK